jgi:hypothetical protein
VNGLLPPAAPLAVAVTDNLDGTVTCRYTPTSVGSVQVRVQVLGAHVPGSPFALESTDGVFDPDIFGSCTDY